MNDFSKKSQKTQNRIEKIKADLFFHKKSIKRLHAFFRYGSKFKKCPHVPRIVKYTSIPKSENRYLFTINNITNQINFLEREIAVLIEYGV